MDFERACIFVDGENLRHSLMELFPGECTAQDYLPHNADWAGFFDSIVANSSATLRLRTYWYVVDNLDFRPSHVQPSAPLAELERLIRKDRGFSNQLDRMPAPQREAKCREWAGWLKQRERVFQSRFNGWKRLQDGIMGRHPKVEFRRAGAITYDLFTQWILRNSEKAVDVDLATDMLELRKIYDVAIILSGDQDYVPAVRKVKDMGKHVINVSFRKRNGELLPGGARRLGQAADRPMILDYADVRKFMNFPVAPSAATAPAQPSTRSHAAAPLSSSPPARGRP